MANGGIAFAVFHLKYLDGIFADFHRRPPVDDIKTVVTPEAGPNLRNTDERKFVGRRSTAQLPKAGLEAKQ